MISFKNKLPGHRMLELGGGDNPHPLSDVNVDMRPGEKVHFTADFNSPLPISSDDFEIIFCQYALEHISWRVIPQFLSEVYRICKIGGKVVFVTSNTEAQLRWIVNHPEGWDSKTFFESASEVLFGGMDYPENSHRCYFSASILRDLFEAARFENIVIKEYGARSVDLLVTATKPSKTSFTGSFVKRELEPLSEPSDLVNVKSDTVPVEPAMVRGVDGQLHPSASGGNSMPLLEFMTTEGRASLFDKQYFNGGQKVGGYSREGYWDFPVHEITTKHVLDRKPESVLEIGCGRGYVLKRLQDAGVTAVGMEISKHCQMTRACEGIWQKDLCNVPWGRISVPSLWPASIGTGNVSTSPVVDLCFSIATLEHVPETHLPEVIVEMVRTCKRGLHGIDFGEQDTGFDKTHCSLHTKEWWLNLFEKHAPGWPVEIVDKEELERGEFPQDVLEGDGKLKLNVGSYLTMFHRGWVNIDQHDLKGFAQQYRYKFLQHDVRNGLPYGTGVVDYIVLSHVLQCLTYEEGLRLLKECRRVIRKDGVMRISVPNAALLMGSYMATTHLPSSVTHQDIVRLEEYDEINDGCAQSSTAAGKLWSLIHAGNQSQYDWDTLEHFVKESLWQSMVSDFRQGTKQILQETLDVLPCLSLFIEAMPKLG